MEVQLTIGLNTFDSSDYAQNEVLGRIVIPLFLQKRGVVNYQVQLNDPQNPARIINTKSLEDFPEYQLDVKIPDSVHELVRRDFIQDLLLKMNRPVSLGIFTGWCCELERVGLIVEVMRNNADISNGYAQCVMSMLKNPHCRFGVVTNINYWQFIEFVEGETRVSPLLFAYKADEEMQINRWLTYIFENTQ